MGDLVAAPALEAIAGAILLILLASTTEIALAFCRIYYWILQRVANSSSVAWGYCLACFPSPLIIQPPKIFSLEPETIMSTSYV